MADKSSKNRLQEYCQKRKLPFPTYRIVKQLGAPHELKFQAEVEVNGQQFTGEDLYPSKIEAHQSAARKACLTLITDDIDYFSIEHLPSEYVDIEQFINQLVRSADGRIRKIRPVNKYGTYRFEITGSYRYCENIHRHHSKNKIFFIVDPIKRTFFQKCYDPNCQHFRSQSRRITKEQTTAVPPIPENTVDRCPNCQKQMAHNRKTECKRCAEIFCSHCLSDCTLCADATHCSRCKSLCWEACDPS